MKIFAIKTSNSSKNRVLHTLEKSMKCGDFFCAPRARIKEKKDIRGGRGEGAHFPQKTGADSAESVVHLAKYQPLPALPPSSTPEERTVHDLKEAYRQCVFKLRWSKQQRGCYIAQHFGGKRFYQLTPDEVELLVYRMRVVLMEPMSGRDN